MKTLRVLILSLLAASSGLLAQSPIPQTAPSATLPAGCKADTSPLSAGEAALFQQDWGHAASFYRAATAANPSSVDAQAGLVRALFGQEKVDEAVHLAERLGSQFPQSAAAQEILGEAYVRSGELDLAADPLALSLHLDTCLGRTHYAEGRLLSLSGLQASAARQFAAAHALAPSDMQTTVDWIQTLPIDISSPMLTEFLKNNTFLSEERREDKRSGVAIRTAIRTFPSTVSVPELPVNLHFIPGPQNGPTPGIASIDIAINGHTKRIVLSTQGAGISMTKTVAQSLGLKPILHYTLSQNYGAGRIHYYLAMAESLRIGSVEFKNVPVQVFDEDWVPAHITEGVEGVFGLGMLQDFLVHVDYTRQQIRLSELPPVPQAQDVYGREVWSTVIPGSPTPSRNGNDWGAFNRSIAPNMQTWTRYFGGTSPYLLTKFGPGPERLFELDLNERHPRLSSAAQAGIGTAKAAGIIFPGSKYSGYFMKFSGIFVPINSWTTERFDNGSERLDLEISGIIDQSALLTTPFSIDYRDQLIHFETSAEK